MKKTTNYITALMFVALTLFLTTAFVLKEIEYKTNLKLSTVKWVGKKVAGTHTGTINLSDGTLKWNGKALVGGNFEMDMNSIQCTDLTDPGYNKKLVDHLKNEDFFWTEKFPKSKFLITKVVGKDEKNYDVTGNLTIKGITHEVNFPVVVTNSNKTLNTEGKITIDRTKYDIKYGSGSFFDNLGDKAIDNNFELDFNLVSNK